MAKKTLITMIRELIEKGATNVEDVHKAIAEMPLKRLAKIEGLRGPIKKLNRMQDRSIGAIYDLIRDINDLIAKYATELLAEKRSDKKKKACPWHLLRNAGDKSVFQRFSVSGYSVTENGFTRSPKGPARFDCTDNSFSGKRQIRGE